jgi:hypothetical protein
MVIFMKNEVDFDEDGLISFQEFVTIMESIWNVKKTFVKRKKNLSDPFRLTDFILFKTSMIS